MVCLSGVKLQFMVQNPMNLCWKLLTVSKIYELCLLALNGFPKHLFIFHNGKKFALGVDIKSGYKSGYKKLRIDQ